MASSPRIEELKKLFDENPRRYFAPLANEYRKAGDVAEAIRICRAHLPQHPGHMSGHIVYGQALYEAGEFGEARQVFEAALALDPENLIALRHLGDIARTSGDLTSARHWYERVLDADPRNEEISTQLQELQRLEAESGGAVAGGAGEGSGWGDINPEQPAASDVPTLSLDDETTQELRDLRDGARGGARDVPAGLDASGFASAPTIAFEPTGMGARAPAPMQPIEPLDFEPTQLGVPAEPPAPRPPVAPLASDFPEFDAFEPSAAEPAVPAPPAGAARAAGPADDFPEFDDASGLTIEHPEVTLDTSAPARPMTQGMEFGDIGDAAPAAALPDEAAIEPAVLEAMADVTDATGEPAPLPEVVAEAPLEPQSRSAEPFESAFADFTGGTPDSAAASGASAALGLESMEFVPPPRASQARVADLQPTHEDDATPAAFVTETMAELYLQQGFRKEALDVYQQLLAQNPDDENLRERIANLEHGGRASIAMAEVSDSVVEDAHRRRGAVPTPRSVRAFFSAIAGRRAPHRTPLGQQAVAPEGDAGEYARAASHDTPAAEPEPGPAAPDDWERAQWDMTPAESGDAAVTPDEEPRAERAHTVDTEAIPPYTGEYDAGSHGTPETLTRAPLDASSFDSAFGNDPGAQGGYHAQPVEGEYMARAETPAPPSATVEDTISTFFGGAAVPSDDESAAATLATVFSGSGAAAGSPASPSPADVPGRPAHQASSELSLDHIFRDGPQKPQPRRATGGFSFDQFFSESAGGTAAQPAAPSPTEPAAPDASGDIEQFNAWLEGLKKK